MKDATQPLGRVSWEHVRLFRKLVVKESVIILFCLHVHQMTVTWLSAICAAIPGPWDI